MVIIRKHIDNVLSQKFSLLDHNMLEEYFTDEELNQETRLVVQEQWRQFDPGPVTPPNLDHVYYKLYYTIHQNKKNVRFKGSNLILKLSRIAAILIIGILSTISIYLYNNNVGNTNDQQVEIISRSGFRNQFKLPDGTTGWLGYGSELKYHVNHEDQRIVDLDGLAFFDVKHQKKRAFIIKTPAKLDIEVLGTKFNVSSYSEDKSCEIVLEEGSVKLNLPNQRSQNMVPNDRVIYRSFDNSIEKTKVDVIDFLAWKDGTLILKDVSLSEACVKLSRFYNVDFDLQTKGHYSQKIRITLKDDPLEDALKLLTIISPVTYQIEERKVLSDNSYSKKKIIIKDK
jgi:ferric-dicitrate binding protein FerR (iron transport regulator)